MQGEGGAGKQKRTYPSVQVKARSQYLPASIANISV